MAETTSRTARVILEYELQKQKLAETRAGTVALQKEIQGLGPTALKSGEGVAFLTGRMTELRERAAGLRNESVNTRAGILGLDTSIKDTSTGAVSLAGNLAKVREELKQTQAAAELAEPSLASLTGDVGGGGGGNVGLTRFGSKLRSLPSTQIPGTGVSTDAIAGVIRLLGAIPTVALPVVGALAAVAGAFALMDKSLEENRKSLSAALEASNKYNQAVAELSTQQARDRIAELQKTNAGIKAANEEQGKAAAAGINSTKETFKGLLDVVSGVDARFTPLVESLLLQKDGTTQVIDSIKTNNEELKKNQTEIDRLTQGLNENAFAANDAAEAEKKLTDARLRILGDNAADLKQILDLEATGTSTQQVQDIVNSKKREIEVNKYYQQAALDLAATLDKNSESFIAAKAEADEYGAAIDRDQNFIDRITAKTYELVGARQKEAETIDAVTKFNDARVKATDDYLAKITDIETKNAEKLVALAVKKADAEEAALAKLVDKIAALNLSAQRAVEDAATKQQRDDLDAQEKFQRVQAKDARDHANKLLEIQQDANDKAEDLIAARDFSGLFRLRRDTNKAIQNENTQYAQQAADRLEAFNQERSDRLQDYARAAEDRNLKYQRDLQDANKQYVKELNAAEDNYNKAAALQQAAVKKERGLLQNKYAEQDRLLQGAITGELLSIQNGNVARALLQNAANQTLLQQAQDLYNGITGLGGNNNTLGVGVPSSTNTVNNVNRRVNANFSINGSNSVNIAAAVRSQLQYLVN